MPKFAHLRVRTSDGYANERIECRGGITVAYEPAEQGGFKYALAICHEHDNYNKKTGRAKSAGRLKSKNHVQWASSSTLAELVQHIIGHVPARWVHQS